MSKCFLLKEHFLSIVLLIIIFSSSFFIQNAAAFSYKKDKEIHLGFSSGGISLYAESADLAYQEYTYGTGISIDGTFRFKDRISLGIHSSYLNINGVNLIPEENPQMSARIPDNETNIDASGWLFELGAGLDYHWFYGDQNKNDFGLGLGLEFLNSQYAFADPYITQLQADRWDNYSLIPYFHIFYDYTTDGYTVFGVDFRGGFYGTANGTRAEALKDQGWNVKSSFINFSMFFGTTFN